MNINKLIQSNTYTTEETTCPGCNNHCHIRLYHFPNGKRYASGNNCEKIYANAQENGDKGRNMFREKYTLLFDRQRHQPENARLRIGIPRALGIYENFPFWHTLLTKCQIEVVLSSQTTTATFERGARTIMADNICYPAKLMHGHIEELMRKKVDRILYPYVVFEEKEDAKSRNSFNCPVISAYADVIRSSINPERNAGIPFDSPVISFKSKKLLRKSLVDYLQSIAPWLTKKNILSAIHAASEEQHHYRLSLQQCAEEIYNQAKSAGRMTILLAGRPYHTDPLIEHKIAQATADMGADVITEHIAIDAGATVYDELNAVSQWAYPNRIFKAARYVGDTHDPLLQMVELTSFGCGPDAFILDEVAAILERYHKNLTILKIDDVNSIGSLKLRMRSLLESARQYVGAADMAEVKPFVTTRPFGKADRRKTIIAPFFAEGYSEYLPALLSLAGYEVVNLPMGSQTDAEMGLQFANNDICYPATLVIGGIMQALQSGEYDLDNTAVIITQTGGQCRATNYYSLIKGAMIKAGYAHVPLLSLATGSGVQATQPGFEIHWLKLIRPITYTLCFADCLQKLYYATAPRQKQPGEAERLRAYYMAEADTLIRSKRSTKLPRLMQQAVAEFRKITQEKKVPVMGIVGEIYVKNNGFSHKYITRWLVEQGVEVVPPSIVDFFSTNFVMQHRNKELHIRETDTPSWFTDILYHRIRRVAKRYDTICAEHPYYRPSVDIFDYNRLSERVLSSAADFGEGWFLPGEICHLAESGVDYVISLQPFGCIANHIISKGVEKRLRELYPHLNMLFLDFDSSTSDANIYNRLHFMVANAKSVASEK
ncbi:MAG: 2-hydroxyacyl-CoA dehydratase [Marinilabiliaceae bacterium]|nr:2-hydroxyacyl-CoA dehydratase [Marinilabiliaceae bacterium]